jgi:hypothetical protein
VVDLEFDHLPTWWIPGSTTSRLGGGAGLAAGGGAGLAAGGK